MILRPNMNWFANQHGELPSVQVYVQHDKEAIQVRFNVEEPLTCYRAEVQGDGGRCYEDSCVEVFIKALDNPNEYFNFEFNSKAFCLAAKGPSRSERVPFDSSLYSKIHRVMIYPQIQGDFIYWALKVKIPFSILGKSKDSVSKIEGNIYKCADLADKPHYLSLYPVDTEKPDFHRPEFFRSL
jgi:hypothetical protein